MPCRATATGDGDDYPNAPMSRPEYDALLKALGDADQFTAHEFDKIPDFEGCLPVEEMARRGSKPSGPAGFPYPESLVPRTAVMSRRANPSRTRSTAPTTAPRTSV